MGAGLSIWTTVRKHLLDPKEEEVASDELRVLSRWWLEFARNVVTVAGLQLLAEATDNWLLRAVAFAAYSALFLYCFSYVRWVIPNVFPSLRNGNVRALILIAVLICILIAGYLLIDWGLGSVIDEIVRLQRAPARAAAG
jgi:hypothetical protein